MTKYKELDIEHYAERIGILIQMQALVIVPALILIMIFKQVF